MAEPLLLLGSLLNNPAQGSIPFPNNPGDILEINMIGVEIHFEQFCSIVFFFFLMKIIISKILCG
jgi:hypothetical protein